MKKLLITVLVVTIVALGSAAIWLSSLESTYDVQRSIIVNTSQDKVFPLVQDFNQWTAWSPWLSMEPDAKVEITGSGKSINDTYSWIGELVGEGSISHTKIEQGLAIEQEILFKAPMESRSSVYWQFNTINDSTTNITWGMKGEMPFYLRFMTQMMDTWIGMDYERGLKMIKELAEKGYVASKVEIVGIVDAPAIHYMGEKVACTMDDVESNMKSSFTKLNHYIMNHSMDHERALSVYHVFDYIKGKVEYSAAIPIKEGFEAEAPFYTGDIAASKALKIKFTGDYQHIGNAWAAGMTYTRTHKIKENKDIPPYEIYLNKPQDEPDPRKWVTEVYMPIK
ncbi:SRPBCC family protein [Saccharicrinis fermentans]|uniref:Transcriptional regulator n=1 Tax=Saccharicrinis fermentans DSM 9555 = JCM 21142 TaxID=869213 RepID=W7YKU7_9BACT|nr:GyrI-like domain-containing protein [Saccharicrinis fermentans]GAF05141.1 transcriptional regulator [Saccharicrinis fermentans DSM 9555 = JCM 21142]